MKLHEVFERVAKLVPELRGKHYILSWNADHQRWEKLRSLHGFPDCPAEDEAELLIEAMCVRWLLEKQDGLNIDGPLWNKPKGTHGIVCDNPEDGYAGEHKSLSIVLLLAIEVTTKDK